MQIKPEKYTPKLKAYLTYSRNPEVESVLLKPKKTDRCIITMNGYTIKEYGISQVLRDEIIKRGGIIQKDQTLAFEGRNKVFNVPVVIRAFDDIIRVRITGDHAEELFETIKKIRNAMSSYQKEPKICVWEKFSELHKIKKEDYIDESKIIQEHKKLVSLVESLQSDVAILKEAPIKKAMKDDKKVMQGVLT